MSVYKEMSSLVELIQSKSKYIYSDACDFGIPVKSFDDPIIKEIKSIALEYYKLPVKKVTYQTGSTQIIEFDGGVGAVLEAGFEKATICYVTTNKNKEMKGFITVSTYTSVAAKREASRIDY
jgi:hypothetical protein